MKKINYVLLVVALLLIKINVNAQTDTSAAVASEVQEEQKKDDKRRGDKEPRGGVRFGFHYAAMYDNGTAHNEALQYFYAGLAKNKKILPFLSLGTGLEYFKNGYKDDDDNKRELHYVSVPIHLKVNIGPVFALGGYANNFRVADRQFINGVKSTPRDINKSEWYDGAFYAGAGVKFFMFTFEARYHWGTRSVLPSGFTSQYFQIGVGVSL